MSYAVEVIADSSGKWCGNAARYASEAGAMAAAQDLAMRWFSVREYRVVESPDPAGWDVIDGKVVSL